MKKMKKMKKYIVLFIILIVIIAGIGFMYFYTFWAKERAIRTEMIEKAYKEVPALDKIDYIDYFAGEKQYYFIFGKNKKDIPILIWENENEFHDVYLFKYVTKDEIEKKAVTISPDITIERINTGIDKNDQLIYEVLYKDKDNRFGYQYFNLKTGAFIKMYKLAKTR